MPFVGSCSSCRGVTWVTMQPLSAPTETLTSHDGPAPMTDVREAGVPAHPANPRATANAPQEVRIGFMSPCWACRPGWAVGRGPKAVSVKSGQALAVARNLGPHLRRRGAAGHVAGVERAPQRPAGELSLLLQRGLELIELLLERDSHPNRPLT